MTTPVSAASLQRAAEMVLVGSANQLREIWNVSEDFDSRRTQFLTGHEPRSAQFFLRLAWSAREAMKESGNPALIDNALLVVALAVRDGLDQPAELKEAADILFSPPLARKEALEVFSSRTGNP